MYNIIVPTIIKNTYMKEKKELHKLTRKDIEQVNIHDLLYTIIKFINLQLEVNEKCVNTTKQLADMINENAETNNANNEEIVKYITALQEQIKLDSDSELTIH